MTHIHDALFSGQSMVHASGDREGAEPSGVRWERDCGQQVGPIWLTDGRTLAECESPYVGPHTLAIHWLLEPRALHPENYILAEAQLAARPFQAGRVFTHDKALLSHPQARPYPHGGTRLHPSDWRIPIKTEPVSIVASRKRSLLGHMLRHEVISHTNVHAYGPEYRRLARKRDALINYRFSVAIENVSDGLWFTEALIDCLLSGTVPIYWGSREALDHWGFDLDGIMICDDRSGLIDAVSIAMDPVLSVREYDIRRASIAANFAIAHEYTCPEDWLRREYPAFFLEVSHS